MVLFWIIASCFAMSLIAWVGLFTLSIREELLQKILLPLVAFSAGSLLGGAFLHLIPETVKETGGSIDIFIWLLGGFSIFFLLEQLLEWHHCHRIPSNHKKPVSYLILVADGLHNLIGGLAIAGSFLVSIPIGIVTWIAAAAHEIPQELGDFGILLHSGWDKMKALTFNFFSALTIMFGGLITYFASASLPTTFLLPFAAGNFIYIASSDLIPEVKHGKSISKGIGYFLCFVAGNVLILAVRIIFAL